MGLSCSPKILPYPMPMGVLNETLNCPKTGAGGAGGALGLAGGGLRPVKEKTAEGALLTGGKTIQFSIPKPVIYYKLGLRQRRLSGYGQGI